jgi:hypothetical protein
MSNTKLRCVLVYRLGDGAPTLLAKYDHANQCETHQGAAEDELYGGKNKNHAEIIGKVIAMEPPATLSGPGSDTFGGFKVVHTDQHQVVYGADQDGICEYLL